MEPRILTPEQFLLTLLVRLAAIAVLATMLARFHRFRRILIFERRGWVDRLVFTLSIGVPLMGALFLVLSPVKALVFIVVQQALFGLYLGLFFNVILAS